MPTNQTAFNDTLVQIEINPQLNNVDLFNQGITDADCILLANALRNNTSVANINLSSNLIGDAGASALAGMLQINTKLQVISLNDNVIGNAGVTDLATALQTNTVLKALILSDNLSGDTSADAIANMLKINNVLQSLALYGNQMGYSGIQKITGALRNNTALAFLAIGGSGPQLGNASAQAVADILNLHSFNQLALINIQIGDAGATLIAAALQNNTSLNYLDLGGNAIGDTGAQALANALAHNTVLTTLRLDTNQIDDAGALALIQALQNNYVLTGLYLTNNVISTTNLNAITTLLTRNSAVTQALQALKANTITTLDLSNQQINDVGTALIAAALINNILLTSIKLRANQISDAGFTIIAEALQINEYITEIDIFLNQIGDVGATSIAHTLENNSILTYIHLGANQIGVIGVTAIANALKENRSALSSLSFNPNNVGNPGNNIGDAGAIALAQMLMTNTKLTYLNLGSCQIGPQGLLAIANAMMQNNSLQYLLLWGNQIDQAGIVVFANVLKTTAALFRLHLSATQIDDLGAQTLAEALKENKSLTILDLSANQITDVGALALIAALQMNYSLTTLNLSNNLISQSNLDQINVLLTRNQQYPSFTVNRINIKEGETLVLSSANIAVTNRSPSPITFAVSVAHGRFMNRNNQTITTFTDGDIAQGNVRFQADAYNKIPLSYNITASNGNFTTPNHLGAIDFMEVNDPPVLAYALPNQTVFIDQAFSIFIPENTFTDPENQSLVFDAELDDNQNLPAWLNFTNHTLRGVAPNNISQHRLSIFARDPLNATAQTSFNLAIVAEEKTNTANVLSSSGLLSTGVLIAIIIGVSSVVILLIVGIVLLQRAHANKNKVKMDPALKKENIFAMHENPAYHSDGRRRVIGSDVAQTNDWDEAKYETGGSQEEAWDPAVYATRGFLVPAEAASNTQENVYHSATQNKPAASNLASERTQAWDGRTYETGDSRSVFWNRDTYDTGDSVSSENPSRVGNNSWDPSTYVTSLESGRAMLIPWDNQVYSTTTNNTGTEESVDYDMANESGDEYQNTL